MNTSDSSYTTDHEGSEPSPASVDEVLSMAVANIQADLTAVLAKVNDLDSVVAMVDLRQSEMHAQVLEGRADHDDIRHVGHIELAGMFGQLFEQELMSLALAVAPYIATRAPKQERTARTLKALCLDLFRERPAGGSRIIRLDNAHEHVAERFQDVARTVARLSDRADRIGLRHAWDFYFVAGRRLDSTWQEPWGPCEYNQPGKFLVTPAYVVDGRVFKRQRIYTARPPAE